MTNQYLWNRIAGSDPDIRAADADRERIAERLRNGHAEGRLDVTELQERLDRCYSAKTHGELRDVVRDLPREGDQAARGGVERLGHVHWRLGLLASLLIVLIALSAATAHHVGWLWIPVVFLIWRMAWWRRRRWATYARRGPDDWI